MSIRHRLVFHSLAAIAALSLTLHPAVAQDTTPLSTGEPVTPAAPAEGTEPAPASDGSYVAATHGDWEIICVPVAEGETEPCQMYQVLRDSEGNATAEITLFPLEPGQEAVAGATILTPLETLLTAQLVMQIDATTAKRYPFTFCAAIGCIARVGFTAAEVDAFRRGSAATWEVVPVTAPDTAIPLTMSLRGFTAAFDDVTARLAQ